MSDVNDYYYEEEPSYETPGPGYPPPPDVLDSLNDLGSTILGKVNDAVEAADFAGLSSSVSKAIRSTADSIGSSLGPTFNQPSTAIVRSTTKRSTSLMRAVGYGWGLGVSGVGAVGLMFGSLYEFFDYGWFEASEFFVGAGFALAAGFCWTRFRKARADRKMHKALDQYARIAGSRPAVSIEELAGKTGESFKDVVANVTRAIDEGYIPHGRIRGTAEGLTMLYLTDRAFADAGGRDPQLFQYRTSERIAGTQHETPAQPATVPPRAQHAAPTPAQAGQNQASQAAAPAEAATPGVDPRVSRIVSEGKRYIQLIHRANDVIVEQDMSDKLDHLEGVVRRIVAGVQERPETVDQLSQFVSYYLPTTGKLVEAYADLDAHDEHGPNAESTRREIKSTLDVINESFDKLADDLLQDTAWDLASDMRVLRTMLAQDGLSDDGGPRADENRRTYWPTEDDGR